MIKFFSNVMEYDEKTNQVKVQDENGLVYIAPVIYNGLVRRITQNTPVIIIMADNIKSVTDFDKANRIRIDAVALPIFNEDRFDQNEISDNPKIVGSVVSGKIQSYVEAGDKIRLRSGHLGKQTLKVDGNETTIQDAKFMNPNFSYGDFAEPTNFLLRFRPDFPYGIPELTPTGKIFEKAAKLAKAFIKLKRR